MWYNSFGFFRKGDSLFWNYWVFFFSHAFPLTLREERNVVFLSRRILFLVAILSALLLSVLYTVYFVVRCCDLCGVLMYLFIWFQLCRNYKETKLKKKDHNTLLSVFSFPSMQQAVCEHLWCILCVVITIRTKRTVCVLLDTQSRMEARNGAWPFDNIWLPWHNTEQRLQHLDTRTKSKQKSNNFYFFLKLHFPGIWHLN